MTTYRDLSTALIGTEVIFLGNVGINPLEPGSSQFELMIPNGTVMVVIENNLLDPTETLTLKPQSAVFQKVVDKWSVTGVVKIGPDGAGADGLAEQAPVDIV